MEENKKKALDMAILQIERGSIISVVCSFESEVTAVVNGQKYNAKSIMNTPVIDHAENIDFINRYR